MRLLMIRHAIAENREVFAESGDGKSDDDRPLTARGRKRMKKNLEGILTFFSRIDLLASSPLTRALQTAKIVKNHFEDVHLEILTELKPTASNASFLKWLKTKRNLDTIAIVGHEPHLSELASFLIMGSGKNLFSIKKGGICLVEFEGKIDSGRGSLTCLIQPSQLRKIGKSLRVEE